MPIFDPTIPQPDDFISDSQQELLDNNVALDDSFAVNHVRFSVASQNGKHTFVQLRTQPSIPPGLTSGEGTIYTKEDSNARTQLFYTNTATGNEYKLTNVTGNADFAKAGAATNGWTWMGQGIIMQYGIKTMATPASSTGVTFPISFVGNPYSIQVTLISTGASGSFAYQISQASVSVNGFSLNTSISGSGAGVTGFYWVAVGKYGG